MHSSADIRNCPESIENDKSDGNEPLNSFQISTDDTKSLILKVTKEGSEPIPSEADKQ